MNNGTMTVEETDMSIYIIEHSETEDLLCQIAEEAAELSQAALKLRRAIGAGQYTPVTPDEAKEHLGEEFADVSLCVQMFIKKIFPKYEERQKWTDHVFDEITSAKLKRWYERMESLNEEKLEPCEAKEQQTSFFEGGTGEEDAQL